jgi:hypothetical protein
MSYPGRKILLCDRQRQNRTVLIGVVSGVSKRWTAQSQARTYDSFAQRAKAKRSLIEADTALDRSLVENARGYHEYKELPEILATDRAKRQIARAEEIREALHEVQMGEVRRESDRITGAMELTAAHARLTHAQAQLTGSRKVLLNAQQELDAQNLYGPRYHALTWHEKIGEREMRVEEQQALLSEHRRRVSGLLENGTGDDALYATRDELNAEGGNTSAVDLAIERSKVNVRR